MQELILVEMGIALAKPVRLIQRLMENCVLLVVNVLQLIAQMVIVVTMLVLEVLAKHAVRYLVRELALVGISLLEIQIASVEQAVVIQVIVLVLAISVVITTQEKEIVLLVRLVRERHLVVA